MNRTLRTSIDLCRESIALSARILREGQTTPNSVADMLDSANASLAMIAEVATAKEAIVDRFTAWVEEQKRQAAQPV